MVDEEGEILKNKSAKDLAFDRERIKYGRKILELKDQIHQLQHALEEKDKEIKQLRSCIELLLKYADMTEAELEEHRLREEAALKADAAIMAVFRGFGIM